MATAQDIMAWIAGLLGEQGSDAAEPSGADALAEYRRRFGQPPAPGAAGPLTPPPMTPPPLAPRLDLPPGGGGESLADAPNIRGLAGIDRRLLGLPPQRTPRVPLGPPSPDTSNWPDPFPGPGNLLDRTPPPDTTPDVRREEGPNADDIVRRATAEAARRPPPFVPGAGERNLRQPDAWDYIDTFLSGGRPVLSTIRDRAGARNATYDAIVDRVIQGGGTAESGAALARGITENQALFAPILPSLFSPRTSIVNNRLVETATGRVIADFSDQFRPVQEGTVGTLNQATGVITPATGLPGRRRDLSAEDIRKLRNEGTQLANVSRLGEAFQNTFSSPNYVVGGDLSNWIARNTTHGSPGMREAARWWQDYTRNSELFERHEMFGAALTPTEQAAWRAADINPNMEPGMVRANLATRHRILTSAVQRYAQSLAASGYDATAVGSAFGLSPDALGIRPGGRRDDALTTPPGDGGFRVLGVR